MNLKKHSFALITGFVFVVVAGGVGYLLFTSRGKFVEAKTKLGDAEAQFTRLSDGTPYPSDENVEVEKQNLEEMQGFHADVEAYLCAGQIRPEPMERAEFPERLEDMYKALRDVATNRSVRLPAEFFFGFDAYVDQLPSEEDVPRLTIQAQVIERLCGLLFSNKVDSVESVTRTVFEKGLSSSSNASFDRGGFGGFEDFGGFESPALTEDVDVLEEDNGLYTTEHVDILFTARDQNVWKVLNALGSSKLFVVTTSIEIESSMSGSGGSSLGSRRSGMSRRGGRMGGFESFGFEESMMMGPRSRSMGFDRRPSSRPTATGEMEGEPALHEDRVVAGREELATVQLGLDVYRFCLEPEVEEGAEEEELFGDEDPLGEAGAPGEEEEGSEDMTL